MVLRPRMIVDDKPIVGEVLSMGKGLFEGDEPACCNVVPDECITRCSLVRRPRRTSAFVADLMQHSDYSLMFGNYHWANHFTS